MGDSVGDPVILTIGNSMMGDDGAGPLLAALLERSPASGWLVFDGGSAPENVMHRVRACEPSLALLFDAVDMGLTPGEVRLVDDRLIAEQPIMTTHNLPVSLLIASLRETIPDVRLLGVQPAVVAFGHPMSSDVERAVQNIHERLSSGMPPSAWPRLVAADRPGDASAVTAPSNWLFSSEGEGR